MSEPERREEPEVCYTIEQGYTTCDGYPYDPRRGGYTCRFHRSPRCPLPYTEGQRRDHRVQYLARVGFAQRYFDPDPERLFNGLAEAKQPIEHLRAYHADITENIVSGHGYLLSGTVGTGKTFALALTALAAHGTGFDVRYIRTSTLFSLLHNSSDEVRIYERCDLLLLDEFGAQHSTDWTVAQFNDFVETRHGAERATCVVTNLSIRALTGHDMADYARCVDRWRESCAGDVLTLGFASLRA
jgi:DNA replication protein DnaC